MMRAVIAGLLVALMATSIRAEETDAKVIIEEFPYCPCDPEGAFYMDDQVTFKGNNTYCFTIRVQPPAGCTSYCCTKADLKKIEIDANPECKIGGQVLRATINGVPSQTAPLVDRSFSGPPNTWVLKLTNIGLTMDTADGAEICYYLGTNNGGKGCTSLTTMCKTPAGAAAGTCAAALFDSKNDCCPISEVGNKKPPPPSPSPPVPSPPVKKPCKTCVYWTLVPPPFNPIPFEFDETAANQIAEYVDAGVKEYAEKYGATISSDFVLVSYTTTVVKVCGEFASDEDGAKLQPYIDEGLQEWLDLILDGGACPPFLEGYQLVITVGGDGPISTNPPDSCLNGRAAVSCTPRKIDFPKCECRTRKYGTPFALEYSLYMNESSANPGYTLYCTITKVITPFNPTSTCGKTNILSKVEFWANDKIRRRIKSFLVAPNGGPITSLEPVWGAYGEDTLKATPLDWTTAQADGGIICMEVRDDTPINEFCLGNTAESFNCWATLFDPKKECCPIYASTVF